EMKRVRWFQVSTLGIGLPLLMGQACPLLVPPGPSDTELTAEEAIAVRTLVQATAALSQAVGVAQVIPDPADPNGPGIQAGQVILGTCPTVTLSVIPFGEGQAF